MNEKTCPACQQLISSRASRCPHCGSRQPDAPPMHRNVPGRVAAGVCAALAEQLGLDPLLVRVVAVASLAITGGLGLWVYGLLWFLSPFDPGSKAPATRLFDWLANLFSRPAPGSPPA